VKLKRGDHKSIKKIVVLGAGVQGTVFGVRLAQRGNEVTLIARPDRAQELRQFGATIQNADTSETCTISLPVMERLASDCSADFCLVTFVVNRLRRYSQTSLGQPPLGGSCSLPTTRMVPKTSLPCLADLALSSRFLE